MTYKQSSFGQASDISGEFASDYTKSDIPPYKHDFDGGYSPGGIPKPANNPAKSTAESAASQRQVGGNHYNNRAIQPATYALANNFNYCESFALKYLTRHRDKGGAEDLRKAIHCIELLIEAEYPTKPTTE